LKQSADGNSQKLEIRTLPELFNIRPDKPDFVAVYVNYHLCNGAVAGTAFGHAKADGRTRAILA
jgi:hypothetical protein